MLLNGKPQAALGAHDDLVLAYAIAWAVRQSAGTILDAMAALTARGGKIFG